jgi:hypothetical protein
MDTLRRPSNASSIRSLSFTALPCLSSHAMIGMKTNEAMLNRIVARRIGVNVERTARAATKESPQITDTTIARTEPYNAF